MPRILGIDTSLTATGLCLLDVWRPDQLASGVIVPLAWSGQTATLSAPGPTKDKSKRAMARRMNVLVSDIEDTITDNGNEKVDLISIEALAYGAKGASVWVLPWLFGRVVELAEKHDVPLIVVGTSQIKKYAVGNGNAPKDQVLIAVTKRWPEFDADDNNEADATVAAIVGAHWLDMPITEPTKYQIDVLEKVTT